MKLTREFYIPKASRKVADKKSDAVAYVYESNGQHFAAIFYGKQAKPISHYRYTNAAKREDAIRLAFEHRRKHHERQKERRVEQNKPHTLELGHIFVASWGYEQTNVNFYQVTKIIGSNTVEIREVEQIRELTDLDQGTTVPKLDSFRGDPIRRKVSGLGYIKVSRCQFAHVWDGRPHHWSSYH